MSDSPDEANYEQDGADEDFDGNLDFDDDELETIAAGGPDDAEIERQKKARVYLDFSDPQFEEPRFATFEERIVEMLPDLEKQHPQYDFAAGGKIIGHDRGYWAAANPSRIPPARLLLPILETTIFQSQKAAWTYYLQGRAFHDETGRRMLLDASPLSSTGVAKEFAESQQRQRWGIEGVDRCAQDLRDGTGRNMEWNLPENNAAGFFGHMAYSTVMMCAIRQSGRLLETQKGLDFDTAPDPVPKLHTASAPAAAPTAKKAGRQPETLGLEF